MSDEPLEPVPPRILSTPNAPFPKAEIQSVSSGLGCATFRWLTDAGVPVDSGGSVVRFTPLEADQETGEFPDADDAVLVEAIENPPIEASARSQKTRVVLDRLTSQEVSALHAARAANAALDAYVLKALATGMIHEDDADFAAGSAALDAEGIIASNRWDDLFA